jgi:hypothetical protein
MAIEEISPKPSLVLGKYLHYKGNLYEVLELACHTETGVWYVIYKSLSPRENRPDVWARPYEMFIENVKVEGAEVPRFKKVTEQE